MPNTVIHTDNAPAAIGPYSQAVSARGRMVFCSGQVALTADGVFLDEDVAIQTRQVMNNLGEVLKAAEASFASVVKTTIFLTDLGDYAAVNTVYAEYFGDAPPARAAIQVSALPKNAKVEIEAIAVV
ncbi:MAG: reactive intermediate/imine deaminase [Rhodobacterales bacterium]|nr:reactive intermediate/imine deaminase [Rhodobacterales bacterium]